MKKNLQNQTNPVLEAQELNVVLGGRKIIQDVSLEIEEGELLGIVGVSGAGKSSLLNAIIGYYPTTSGKIFYRSNTAKDKIKISDNPNVYKMFFGFSAQDPSFYPELTIMENLAYFASLYNVPKAIFQKNMQKALNLVELQSHANVQARNLSGGMKKRLDIACALVHTPKILILDEPTSDMDPILRIQIWKLLENINKQGTTIIIASHFLSELEHFCDKIAFLHKGSLKFFGRTNDFKKKYASTKEVEIIATEGNHSVVLKKIADMPTVEIKHSTERNGRILAHMQGQKTEIERLLSEALGKNEVNSIDIRDPSLDTLFKIFLEK